ncbi:inactive tyrosine-protein kinase PRAG1 [Thalassophryne amazonica]|uniref:inactive tyrosine-protein kinase PRAG1 n=1 Tax=Thalassophryne amazonica TaxID=390379 RepID=UPI0014714D71|nr:inactive tyrosine-protein kinase PRAG1 [Thalassophryne amazonica]XP_034047506.1 inactive tyrosine-protein kinase PRAG1 [Thalassophryne amazonica]
MSACSDFAEHVWKPGSCKNCFHPLSAHKTIGGLDGRLGGDEETGVTVPSPYNKPTIAVKPTMMNLDPKEAMTDVNMNIEEENAKSPLEHLGLKNLLGLTTLYIDSNGCNKAHRETVLQSPESKRDYNNYLLPSIPLKDSMIISNVFVTQEEGRGSQSLQIKANGESCRQHGNTTTTVKNTCNGSGVVKSRVNCPEVHQGSLEIPLSVDIITSSSATVHSNNISGSTVTATTATTSTCITSPSTALSVDAISQPSLHSPPNLSGQTSLSDSSCSYRSSTDSLPGPDGLAVRQIGSESPQSPQSYTGSSQSLPNSPNRQPSSEPIYAESTKKRRRPQGNEAQSCQSSHSQSQIQNSSHCPEIEVSGEGQRATITVMAARTEENNRTFFLSSPDSGVSTHCHFSPTARKDPSSPAFRWPSPSRSSPSLASEASLALALQPKSQSSPPIPPKRSTRSPKLGTSSLSSPVVSPVPLSELPMLVLISPREAQFKVHTDKHTAASDRWHKPHNHNSGWNCRIEEEEEEEERERKVEEMKRHAGDPQTASRVAGMVNGAAVWPGAKDCKAPSSPPSKTEPGTALPAAHNNVVCQGKTKGTGTQEEAKHNRSMPTKQSLLTGSSESLAAGKGAATNEPNPPPPPPKKLHRVCGKMSSSSLELDRCSQQGSVEGRSSSQRGLGSAGLRTASTDSLSADTGTWAATRTSSCSSPKSPVTSAPGSPRPPTVNSLSNQPPPLPEKKMVNRTVSAPDSANGKPFIRAYPRLPFSGSETNVCRPVDVGCRSSLPSSPVDPQPVFSSSESLEHCHASPGRPLTSRTLDEPLKSHRRLGVHCRSSITCSSSPQLNVPFSSSEQGTAPSLGSNLQLQTLLSNIDSREGVYSKLGGLYAESLRRLALKCEDHFTRSQKNPLRFEESNWSLFRLTSNKPTCSAGDAVYYSAACASDPSNSYAVKICKSPSMEAKQGHLYSLSVQQSMRSHFNLQQDCGHFLACIPQSMLPSNEVSLPTKPASSLTQPSATAATQQADRERVVVITPEIPQQTAADFVREWEAFHKSQPEVYERRVCFLLLQLCNGLEHLKEHGVTHRDLCLENLLLVPHHCRPLLAQAPPTSSQFSQQLSNDNGTSNGSSTADIQRHLPRLLISNFAKAKRRSSEDAASTSVDPRLKREHARLAPEIVSAAQYRKFDEFQTGILIYELLHQPNPFEVSPALKEQDYCCEELPPIPPVSLYSTGLQRLAQLLLQPDPIKRIHIQEAKRILQSLLWGPRKDLMEQQWERRGQAGGFVEGSRHEGLLNWLDVKRALLMMKFAERSLEPERNAELEDWLCCQYFSSAHPLSLCHTAELLYSLK